MATTAKSEPTRSRAASASLTTQYRAIGPASVAAALLFARKRKSSTKSP